MENQNFIEKILNFGLDWKVIDIVLNKPMKEVEKRFIFLFLNNLPQNLVN